MNSQILSNLMDKLNHLLKDKKKKQLQLLEPLSTVIRLAILYFDLQGTKIAIYNNRIFTQKPTLMQGTIRWTYGNKRNELHYLYKPIVIAINQYNSTQNKNIKIIFEYAIKGLDKLRQTYKKTSGTIICHSIDLYKEAIQKAIEVSNSNEQNSNKNKNKNNNNNTKCNVLTESIRYDDITSKLYNDFNKLWDAEQIKIIADLLNLANKQKTIQTKTSFIEAIDSIIKDKEKQSLELINIATENITN